MVGSRPAPASGSAPAPRVGFHALGAIARVLRTFRLGAAQLLDQRRAPRPRPAAALKRWQDPGAGHKLDGRASVEDLLATG